MILTDVSWHFCSVLDSPEKQWWEGAKDDYKNTDLNKIFHVPEYYVFVCFVFCWKVWIFHFLWRILYNFHFVLKMNLEKDIIKTASAHQNQKCISTQIIMRFQYISTKKGKKTIYSIFYAHTKQQTNIQFANGYPLSLSLSLSLSLHVFSSSLLFLFLFIISSRIGDVPMYTYPQDY